MRGKTSRRTNVEYGSPGEDLTGLYIGGGGYEEVDPSLRR